MSTTTVKLQINTAGAWRDVVPFDDANARQFKAVLKHAPKLAELCNASLRIVTTDGNQTVCMHWTKDKGWRYAETNDQVVL
jgi:hypothetical protein